MMQNQANLKKIVVKDENVKIDSYVYNTLDEGVTKDYFSVTEEILR